MVGLAPGARYNYTVTSDAADVHAASRSFTFTALRAPPSSPGTGTGTGTSTRFTGTQIACFGDMGTVMPLGSAVAQQLAASHGGPRGAFDAIFHFGDVSYAGTDSAVAPLNITKADEWEYIWDLFGAQMEPIASAAPYLVGVGNHEAWYNFTAYRHRFNMPAARSGGNGNFWWSVDVGLVHVLSFSTEHDFRVGTEQLAWIEKDLAAANANRAAVPWVIFSGHRPWLSADLSGYSSHIPGALLLATVEPLFFQYGVDLTLVGHQHCYERIHPSRNGTVLSTPDPSVAALRVQYTEPRGPVHVVQGSAGALQEEKWAWPAPAWSAVRLANGHNNVTGSGGPLHYESTYGFGRLHAPNATHLRYMFEPLVPPPDGGGAISDPSLQDDFWIVKPLKKTNG